MRQGHRNMLQCIIFWINLILGFISNIIRGNSSRLMLRAKGKCKSVHDTQINIVSFHMSRQTFIFLRKRIKADQLPSFIKTCSREVKGPSTQSLSSINPLIALTFSFVKDCGIIILINSRKHSIFLS